MGIVEKRPIGNGSMGVRELLLHVCRIQHMMSWVDCLNKFGGIED